MPLVSMPTNLSSTSRLGAGSTLQPAALDGDEAGGDGGGGGGGREAGSSSTRALRRLEGSFSMRSTKRSTAVGAAAKAAVGEGAGGAGAAAVGGGSDGGEVKPTGKGPAGSGHSSVPHTTSVMMSIMALEQPNDPGVTAALRQVRAFQPTDDAEKLLCLQVGFFEIVVLPLYRAFAAAFPGAFPLLHAAKDNYRYWRQQQELQQQQQLQQQQASEQEQEKQQQQERH
ncbi:hypothetical protein V8C86DRAFT_3141473 [Haematococcus lacustris]